MFRRWREWRTRRGFAALDKVAAQRQADRVRQRTPLEALHPLVRELVEIAGRGGFLDGGELEARTRAIGAQLHAAGGMEAMRAAHQEVYNWEPFQARSLERAWDRVGDWLG